ncbi:MAG: LysM domain-containing protein [Acidimicrobiales bacterium]
MTNTCSVSVLPFPTGVAQSWSQPAPWIETEGFDDRGFEAGGPSGTGRGSPATTRLTARQRRLRTLLAAAAIAVIVLLALPLGGTGGHTLAASGAAGGGRLVAGTVYTVRPGDTLWGIAQRVVGNNDPRPVVDQLEAEAGGDIVQPGQQLRLP